MNNSSILTTTFCRKCKKLRSCLNTNNASEYRYLCKECAKSEHLSSECKSCGREGVSSELMKHGGYCHLCEDNNIAECELCGAEVYSHNIMDGVCINCQKGFNKPCDKCGTYMGTEKLKDGLCEKCRIKLFKKKYKENADEVFECIECGREQHINNMENGLCMFCYKDREINKLKNDMRKVKKKVYSYR